MGVADPAINGGLAILNAASRHGGTPLKCAIHVGSFSSTVDFELGDAPELTYGPDTWNPVTYEQAVSRDYVSGYVGSKVLVERAMWDSMKVKRSFDLVTVLPATVFGPHIAEPDHDNLNVSSRMLWELASPSESPSPWHFYHMGAWVDVRDAAEALLRSAEVPEAGGQRFVAAQRTQWQFVRDAARYRDELRARVDPGMPGA
ncbi:putative Epimerase domain-containing protein [Seiridium unicorne]|uniref:Epimerase domain-containing protein n=1 Tax=Seiridium unicorne TaxID=138068 RepID=A0ABR2V1E4_9PEZI